jgi:hypothetical protein
MARAERAGGSAGRAGDREERPAPDGVRGRREDLDVVPAGHPRLADQSQCPGVERIGVLGELAGGTGQGARHTGPQRLLQEAHRGTQPGTRVRRIGVGGILVGDQPQRLARRVGRRAGQVQQRAHQPRAARGHARE